MKFEPGMLVRVKPHLNMLGMMTLYRMPQSSGPKERSAGEFDPKHAVGMVLATHTSQHGMRYVMLIFGDCLGWRECDMFQSVHDERSLEEIINELIANQARAGG